MSFKFSRLIIVASTFAVLTACQGGSSAGNIFERSEVKTGDTLVTINGLDLHQGFLDTLAAVNPRVKPQLDNPISRKKIISQIVEQVLLFQEAEKRSLQNDNAVSQRLDFIKMSLLSNSVVENELDASMKKAYEERKNTQFTKVGISQIAVNFQSDADKKTALDKIKAAKARLDKGEDFSAVAKEVSDDKVTKNRGGDAGQVSKDDRRYAKSGLTPLVDAAFKLKKGGLSDPIETKSAYYLIKANTDPEVVSYEDAKRVLGFEMQATVKAKLLADLKGKAKIEYPKSATAETPAPATVKPTAPVQPVKPAEPAKK